MRHEKAAIIDMGTNTFHLLLVDLNEEGFEILYKEKIPVKIGQKGISKNEIHPDAQKRAMHTLGHFRNLINGEKIENIYAFATSAVRNAHNGMELVQEIKNEFNIEVNVIDGEQEAQLIYEGIRFSGSLVEQNSLMMDIGGGSVEFIIGSNHEAIWKQSFEIGGQRMLDLFHYHDPILPDEIDKLKAYLSDRLEPLIKALEQYRPKRLVGASGTFDTLTDMYYATAQLTKTKSQTVFHLPRKEFAQLAQKIVTLNKEQRLNLPGMIPMRVDMIVVASCLIEFILQYVDADELICSNYALKEGVISKILKKESIIPCMGIEKP
ncbi:exopolyphosphatase [Echinicola strongylocentroti]|uniref:Exopolyphosphatase n=1 Tax=Echinicola strongylocentroti TaxID=1795355 RepID=A0A2Z4IFQ2_9BACT|nr:exopolyphosphatase [Echinicola strongylocentroti]AWW29951.1 exopolyphosphatase [Echinicola strongylocentroti]